MEKENEIERTNKLATILVIASGLSAIIFLLIDILDYVI